LCAREYEEDQGEKTRPFRAGGLSKKKFSGKGAGYISGTQRNACQSLMSSFGQKLGLQPRA